MAVGEGHTLTDEAIKVWRVHVGIAERANRVEPLLVGDDEDDVGPLAGHETDILAIPTPATQDVALRLKA